MGKTRVAALRGGDMRNDLGKRMLPEVVSYPLPRRTAAPQLRIS
jgi:hypothetical protein